MAQAAMGGLFGPSADEVRLAIAQQGREQDMQWGNLEPGRGPTVLAAQSGRMLGDALAGLGGYQDPRVKSAQLMQEAAQEVDNQGYSLLENSQEYYKAAYASLMKRGLTAEAAHVRGLALNESATQSKINLESAQAQKALKDEFGATRNGMVFNKNTGEIVREGTFEDPKSQIISLYPPGTIRKGEASPKTFDMSKRDTRQQALQLMGEGWVDDNALPGPEGQGQTIDVKVNTFAQEEGIKDINKQVEKLGNSADQARAAVKSIDSSLSLLQTSKFKTGVLAETRKSIGDTFSFLGFNEAAQAWKVDGADAASLNASLKGVVANLANSLDQGADRTSAKEIELAMSQVGGTGVPEEGLFAILNIAKKQKQAEIDQYEYSLRAAEEASKEAGGNADIKNIIFRRKVNDWKNSRPPIITPKEVEEIKRSARLMREAKDVKPLEFYTGDNVKKLKVGMRVTEDGFLRKVKGFKTYKKGTHTVDGVTYVFDRDTQVPDLEPVR